MLRPTLACLTAAVACSAARAVDGVVAVANVTDKPVAFAVRHGDASQSVTLAPGQCRPVPVGRQAEIAFTLPGRSPARFALDPFTAYVFAPGDGGPVFQGVELAAPLPPPADLPAAPAAPGPVKVPVRLLCDAADPRTPAAWERALRARVAAANAILEVQANVTLDVASVGQWPGGADDADSLTAALRAFERDAKPGDARLVIGFTPRKHGYGQNPAAEEFAAVKGVLARHVLVRDAVPRTDAEKAEVLVRAVGTWLGAAGSPDPNSVMRPKLGDGRATLARFHVQFDPLNALAVNLWSAEYRTGTVNGWADLPKSTRGRLTAVYKTLQAANPKDPAAADALDILARLDNPAAAVAAADPAPAKPADREPAAGAAAPAPDVEAAPADGRRAAIRQVVRGVTLRAQAVRDMPAAERPKGDKLTNDLVRAAADVAAAGDKAHAAAGFLVGLGVALDDSTTLRDNVITRDLVRGVETDAERKERLAALGRPLVRGRRDLCQHFAVSAALTEIVGARTAELAGLTKEVKDLAGESGFSFPDLLADLSGIALAEGVLADPARLAKLRTEFDTEKAVPDINGLREGLTAKRFEADYGGLADPRFQAALAEVRRRVAGK